ncbi:MAG: polysaccharide lyase [Janthinobacterium lividum]
MITHALVRTGLTLAGAILVSTALVASPITTGVAQAAPTSNANLAKKQKPIVSANFNSTKIGKVDPTSFRSQVGSTNKNTGAYLGMTYRKDYRGSGNVVRTTLTKNMFIGSSGGGRGNVLMVKLPGSYDSACMSYDVRFAAGFDFSSGGKLPGFVGVAPGVTATTPTGGGSSAHGWSGRLMWLGSKMWKLVRDADRSNMVVTYLYHPGQVRRYGDNVSWGSSFKEGVWHHVKQCNVMNTVGRADGVLQTWFDGQLVMEQTDVVYRTDPNVHITHFDWSIFRGGDNADWASATDGYVDMDNLKITAG